jgi:hypothetical protein
MNEVRDRKLVDLFNLVVGILVGFFAGLVLLSGFLAGRG